MDGARLRRLRWRLRGAWLWPTFVVLIAVDTLIGHELPPQGDGQSAGSALLVAMLAMLLGIVLLAPALAALMRRRGSDMPVVVARDYAGTAVILLISGVLLVAGLVHRSAVDADSAALADAVSRADAWIAHRAPAQFAHNFTDENTYVIQPGSVYRTCVRDRGDGHAFCVVVTLDAPPSRSVIPSGSEPNAALASGTG